MSRASVGLSRERTQSMLHHMADMLSAEHVCHEKRCEHTNYIGRIYIDVTRPFCEATPQNVANHRQLNVTQPHLQDHGQRKVPA